METRHRSALLVLAPLPFLPLLLLAACEAEDGPSMEEMGPDPAAFFEPAPRRTAAVMSGPPATPGGPAVDWNYVYTGSRTIDGREFYVLTGTEQTATPNTIEVVVRVTEDTAYFASFTVDDYAIGYEGVPDFVITGPEPVKVKLDVPVGEPQTVTADGELIVAGTPNPGSITATYTLVDDDATVETPNGPISGCRHYSAASDTNPPLTGEVWISTGVGIVAAKYDFPLISPNGPKTWNLTDFEAEDDVVSGRKRVRRDATLAAGSGEYRLSTTRDGVATADKNVHAKMLLEARWADAVRAAGDQPPPVDALFTGGWGYFPEGSIDWQPLPFSILNPHENGAGYRYWYKFVDQALKNESFQPNGYTINADWEGTDGAVRLSGMINYKVWEP